MDFNLTSGIHILSMMSISCLILLVTKIVFIFIDIRTDRSRFINAVVVFLFFLFLQQIQIFKYLPWFDTNEYEKALTAIIIFLGSTVFVTFLDFFIWNGICTRGGNPGLPKILTHILMAIIYFLVLLSIANKIYGMPITTLLAATGLLTFILGYASQQTLSNFFAGIAIQFGGKLKKGQFIDAGGRKGVIQEFNWRSVTLKYNYITIIPNTTLAHDNVTVISPDPLKPFCWSSTITINAYANTSKILKIGNEVVRDISREPNKPSFKIISINGDQAIYLINIHVASIQEYFEVRGMFFTSFYSICIKNDLASAFVNIKIKSKYEQHPFFIQPSQPTDRQIFQALKAVTILKDFDTPSIKAMQEIGDLKYFAKGEHIIRQHSEGDSIFFIIEGEVQTMELHDQKKKPMRSLGALDVFGLKAFLLGEPRRISVEVRSFSVWVLEIRRECFTKIMDNHPLLLPNLTAILVEREESNIEKHKSITNRESNSDTIAHIFASKIKELFKPPRN